jgi:hypothetical protein
MAQGGPIPAASDHGATGALLRQAPEPVPPLFVLLALAGAPGA